MSNPNHLFCGSATKLIRDLKSSQKWLPAYDENAIKEILAEMQTSVEYMMGHHAVRSAENNKRVAAAAAGGPPFVRYDVPPETQVAIDAHLACVTRNRRCVLAYLMTRLAALRAVWWSSGSVVHEEMRAVCSAAELTAHATYDSLVTKYMASIDLTLTESQTPPKTLLVEVRPLRDIGQVDTELGTVNLERNTVQLLRRADAEMLIRQGALEQVKKV